MSQTTENLSEYLKQLDSYMKRLENNELSINDRKLFFDLSIEYYGIFQVAEEFPEELLQGMLEFINSITEQFDDSKELARKYRNDFVQLANEYIDTTLRSELSFGIFDIDSEIFKLEREKIQMMQKLADLDIKMYGKLTEQTQEILEVQNCEILDGQVREVLPWERTDSIPEFMPEMSTAIQENIRKQEHQRVRLKFPYMTRDTFMAVRDEIKRMGAEFIPERKGWYVDRSVGKETITNIQDYIASHDEAIYLKLPPAGPQEFKEIINQIKQDGARYNPEKKRWYITEDADRKKFWNYLPTHAMIFKPEKDSVHEKLNQYKNDAKQQSNGGSKEKEGDKRETPEIG